MSLQTVYDFVAATGQVETITFSDHFEDLEGDPITYTVELYDPFTLVYSTPPSWITYNSTDLVINATTVWYETKEIVITPEDLFGNGTYFSFYIQANNTPPTLAVSDIALLGGWSTEFFEFDRDTVDIN